jgi:hypothetical protein
LSWDPAGLLSCSLVSLLLLVWQQPIVDPIHMHAGPVELLKSVRWSLPNLGSGPSGNDPADVFGLSSSPERRFGSGSPSKHLLSLVMFAGWVMMVNYCVPLLSIGVCGASPTPYYARTRTTQPITLGKDDIIDEGPADDSRGESEDGSKEED